MFVFCADASVFPMSLLRLCYVCDVPISLPEERRVVLESTARKLKEAKGVDLEVTEDLVNASAGLNLHEVESAAIESWRRHGRFTVEAFTQHKIALLRKHDIEYVEPSHGFEAVGGYAYLKEYVRRRVVDLLRNPGLAAYYGLSVPKGIVMYGIHGTGKTHFARALAKEVGLTMVKLDASQFMRSLVGESEQRVKQVVEIIESLAPVVVFIDEIDQLFVARTEVGAGDSGTFKRVQSTLLEWLSSKERRSFLVGATNLLEHVDPAFVRAGRVDDVVLVLPPDLEARREILHIHTQVVRRMPLADDVDLDEVARETYMWTGGELEQLCKDAASLALEERSPRVTMEHFLRAMKARKINVRRREEEVRRMVEVMSSHENVNQLFLEEALKVFAKSEERAGELLSARLESLLE
ncbi:MAG: hypothetical protein DRJ56_06455 [Thermoprotei archaeon]|nr:MAG: hypothetical protein DRJ56_06455 [Thermoprotei archaeon]